EEQIPTTRWLYAELDALPDTHAEQQRREVSRCEMNGGVSSPKVFIHSGDDQVPCTSKSNGQAIFNRSSHSEPVDVVSHGEFTSRSSEEPCGKRERLHSDSIADRNEHDAVAGERRCSTPPLMTSTPYTTLERKDRNQMEMLSDGRELRQSQSVPSILCGVAIATDGSSISEVTTL
ncbi:hypothetical protein OSTOST_22067, partial [Ostertagia ostertagi]